MAVTTPITIYTGSDLPNTPTMPVRITNFTDLVDAVTAQINAETDPTFDTIQMNTSVAEPAHSEGLMYWDSTAKTLAMMTDVNGVVLQAGQEMYIKARNNSGGQIDNGEVVYITGATGNRPTIDLAQADDISTSMIAGVATEDIANNADGYVTAFGVVRNIDTSAFVEGDTLYLSPTTPGALTATQPTQPNTSAKVGIVARSHATQGQLLIDGNRNFYVDTQLALSEYIEINGRNLDEQIHGGFGATATAQPLNNAAPINITNGIGKVFIVVNAGSDIDGTLTITGDSVNRDTGAVTIGDTDVLTIDALTTDSSDTDAEGNSRHSFTGAYISTKWFRGACVISTTNLTLTDVDVYNISFEQVNDTPNIVFNTFDVSLFCNNVNAWFYGYTYLVEVDTSTQKADISRVSTLELPVGVTVANKRYRLRQGNLAQSLDGSTDGIWVEIFFGPTPQAYFENVSIKNWFTLRNNLA